MPWNETESGLRYWAPSPAEAAAMRRKHLEMVEALQMYERVKQTNAASPTLPGLDQQILGKLSAMHHDLRALKTQPISTRTGDPRKGAAVVALLDDYKQMLLSEHPDEAVAAEWMNFLCGMGGKAKIDALHAAGLLRDSEIREAETPQGKSALQKRLDRATKLVEGYQDISKRFKEIQTAPASDVKYGQMLDEGLGIQGDAAWHGVGTEKELKHLQEHNAVSSEELERARCRFRCERCQQKNQTQQHNLSTNLL